MEKSLANRFRNYAMLYHSGNKKDVKEEKTNQLRFIKFYQKNSSRAGEKDVTDTKPQALQRRTGIRLESTVADLSPIVMRDHEFLLEKRNELENQKLADIPVPRQKTERMKGTLPNLIVGDYGESIDEQMTERARYQPKMKDIMKQSTRPPSENSVSLDESSYSDDSIHSDLKKPFNISSKNPYQQIRKSETAKSTKQQEESKQRSDKTRLSKKSKTIKLRPNKQNFDRASLIPQKTIDPLKPHSEFKQEQ